MSEVYIRSQNREQLLVFGNFNSIEYNETNSTNKRCKEPTVRNTICISDGCLEEIAEYESKERCLEVLDEIQKVCGQYLYAEGFTGLVRGSTAVPPMAATIPRVYEMPER